MKKSRQRLPRRGSTTVEFAFVAIPMFLMIFACIEFARVAMVESMAEDAAYTAARHVMVAGSTTQEGIDEAERILAMVGATGTVDVTPYSSDTEQDEINDDTDQISVSIEVDMANNTLFLSMFTSHITISKSCTISAERYEGYYDGGSN